ncbi:MAG TPA: hypothetical protein VMW42_10705 [Desulfatiglandales bacterium]|nr:hypothetical protein [Desulfatiglandales bacterium]
MPKIAEYPMASLKKSLELARAVDELGGNCSLDMCAEKLHRQVSGGFRYVIYGATKFNLVVQRKGMLTITSLYKDIKLAYSEEQKEAYLQTAFLNVPLFKNVCDRFKDQKLPISILDKLLIREFGVGERMVGRVKKYFIEGAKMVGLLSPENKIISLTEISNGASRDIMIQQFDNSGKGKIRPQDQNENANIPLSGLYSVRISGPGVNFTISITENADLEVVKLMLEKIKGKINTEEKTKEKNRNPIR